MTTWVFTGTEFFGLQPVDFFRTDFWVQGTGQRGANLAHPKIVEQLFVQGAHALGSDRLEPRIPQPAIDMQGIEMVLDKVF